MYEGVYEILCEHYCLCLHSQNKTLPDTHRHTYTTRRLTPTGNFLVTVAKSYFNILNFFLFLLFLKLFFERERERERERQRVSRGGTEREGDTESKTGSRL